MAILVQKFGGTSVGTVERINKVAERILATKAEGNDLIVIVSAMAGETDRLLGLAGQITAEPDPRELDQLLATGEQVSIALVSLAIQAKGGKARSFAGQQIGIATDSSHTRARILSVNPERIVAALHTGHVAIVAGFQGITPEEDIATLGRGGSDTTAVAVAARLQARCEIFTDVEGIYTTDPRIVPEARLLPRISYDEMIEMSSSGAKVMETRSMLFAKRYQVPLVVRSSLTQAPGTLICDLARKPSRPVVGVTYDKNEVLVGFENLPHRPGVAAAIFGPFARKLIGVDMIIQSAVPRATTSLSFTCRKVDLPEVRRMCESVAKDLGAQVRVPDHDIAKVSIVGAGMRTQTGVAAAMFEALGDEGINIEMTNSSEIRVSCIIRKSSLEAAVRCLHRRFELEKADE